MPPSYEKINYTLRPANILLDFIAEAKRGVCADVGHASGENEDE